ncbi:MAG: lipoyl(octanoyl) transferase LipB [bacterium]|jgi:lipoyl(octanoyl) transferase
MEHKRKTAIPVYRFSQDTSYEEVTAKQEEYVELEREAIFLCEHPPTITMGSAATPQDLTLAPVYYERMGVTIHKSPRGGKATYHGPGQLVCYPILNLRQRNITLHAHLHFLESLMIQACSFYGIHAGTIEGKTGAWTGERKIGFVGVRVRKGFCYHGCSLNVLPQAQAFHMIIPCGMPNLHVTSIHEECRQTPTVWDVGDIMESILFKQLFSSPVRQAVV